MIVVLDYHGFIIMGCGLTGKVLVLEKEMMGDI
jgi:hypothetical protein